MKNKIIKTLITLIMVSIGILFAICLEDNIEFQIEHHRYFDNKRLDPQNICIPIRHIKYVNQLQNLYFTLTGEELEVKQ